MTIIGDGTSAQAGATADSLPDAVLYQSERTRIYRMPLPSGAGSMICKEPLGPDAVERLQHERAILALLDGVAGVPQLVRGAPPSNAIALHEYGGVPLAQVLLHERLSVPALVALALDLSRIIAAVHWRGVVHRDINPGNILLAGAQRTPLLIDFHLASGLAEQRAGALHQRELAGTLAYLSPEQTGRTGHAVDHRADLYAFGATLYELAVGHPPFRQKDALQLVHEHLTRAPVAPSVLAPQLPPALSDIILRLLEKEPERRYQSAEGLAHDLARLAGGERHAFPLGERDFPLRLAAPSQLVGRAGESALLQAAFERAMYEPVRGVVIAGAAGVGKTALAEQLRILAGARNGRFVCGKYDRQRDDRQADAVHQTFRAFGRLLLAEPEEELLRLRALLIDAMGGNAGLVAGSVPEFGLLLDVPVEQWSGDASDAPARLFQGAVDLLRTTVSPERPLVMVIEDLQWAHPLSLGVANFLMLDPDLRGLLLVATYRAPDISPAHRLAAMLPAWERQGALMLALDKLAPPELGALLGQMLRLAPAPAAALAAALGEHTGGNPYETIELVNALRRDGILTPTGDGWTWDSITLQRYVGNSSVADLLCTRIARLPAPSRALLDTMACLGGDIPLDALQAAAGLAPESLREALAAPLEDGLLEQDADMVRFRHDRVQQTVYAGLALAARKLLHLEAARRLSALPQHLPMAAAQYLPATDLLDDALERARVIDLFSEAAGGVRLGNYVACERLLAAALQLLSQSDSEAAVQRANALRTERHAALFRLGRNAEADTLYGEIEATCPDPLTLAGAGNIQIASLMNRQQPGRALALGLDLLRQLGLPYPEQVTFGEIGPRLEALARWVTAQAGGDPSLYPETTDDRILAIASILERTTPAAFFMEPLTLAWLTLETQRLWSEHGICAAMIGPLCSTGVVSVALRGDYRLGYDTSRYMLEVSAARGYELENARALSMHAVTTAHWFDPLEDCITSAHLAHERLLQGGDLQTACFAYVPAVCATFECGATLAGAAAEANAALTYAGRTGNDIAAPYFVQVLDLALELQSERAADAVASPATVGANVIDAAVTPVAHCNFHIMQALGGALLSDPARLISHAATAMELSRVLNGTYGVAQVYVLQALALAQRAQAAPESERTALWAQFDQCRDWMARRAADAPVNFLHLLKLIDAEQAWAQGDAGAAGMLFDDALCEAEKRQRPWHHALIAERAGLCQLALGMRHAGRMLLADARRRYLTWGAAAKVRHMEDRHDFLRAGGQQPHELERRGSVSTDSLHMLAVLRASQALSSETSLARLKARVAELLGAMTGATRVEILLPQDEPQGWILATGEQDGASALRIEDAAAAGLLPLSAFHYVERTRAPLAIEDIARDDRFAHDPYVAGLEHCSLLLLPILSQGALRAVLLLENRLRRGAFSAERLDAVQLIAGQLAVSLDNSMLYASLERKVAERTRALEQANRELAALSITDALTGLANRRQFNKVLEAEWLRASRPHMPLGAVMIDVDQFKLYNDHYGHQRGDACLKMVADTLAHSMRQGVDLVARYGGEEFAVILPGADLAETYLVAERARAAVAALAAPHATSIHGVVTVSIGIASMVPAPDLDQELLFGTADAALYQAKQNGRNRVMGN
ncbi:MAG: diguanylate cyclase [Pseudomonadota bacterium]